MHVLQAGISGQRAGRGKRLRPLDTAPARRKDPGLPHLPVELPDPALERDHVRLFKGQRNVRSLRSFWNQNMGRASHRRRRQDHPELLDGLRRPGTYWAASEFALAIGIDVGTTIHVWCWHFDPHRRKMLWNLKTFRNWGKLDEFLGGLHSWVGVIDAHPEKSKSYDLALKYHGKLWIGFSDDRPQAHEVGNFSVMRYGEPGHVTIDKTMALDNFIKDMINGQTVFPPDARELGESMPGKPYNGLYHQLTQMVRVEEENTRGTMIAHWKKNRNADHWHHAGMFATVAALQSPQLSIPAAFASAMNRSHLIKT
jgi:hypothetical protein